MNRPITLASSLLSPASPPLTMVGTKGGLPAGRARSRWLWLVGAALASAALCRVCVAPFGMPSAVLVSWAPLLLVIERISWRRALMTGLLQGVAFNACGFVWLLSTLHAVAGLSMTWSLLLFLVFVVFQGGRSAAIALVVSLGARRGWSPLSSFPVSLVAAELVYPCLFPWDMAALASARPSWLQLAEFGGPLAVAAWIGVVNAGVAVACSRWRRDREHALRAAALAVGVVTLATVIGRGRIEAVTAWAAAASSARVGVVQGNLGPGRLDQRDSVPIYRAASLALLQSERALDLLVWPEGAVSSPVKASRLRSFVREHLLRDADHGGDGLGVPLLAGMSILHDEPLRAGHSSPISPAEHLTNSALLVNRRGEVEREYDKRRLMPLTEKAVVPGWLARRLHLPGGPELRPGPEFRGGRRSSVMALGEHRLAVAICYEEILHGWTAWAEDESPDLLVHLTSDAWFRDSSALQLHLAVTLVRAVEHRRFVLRATTTGVTAVIDPTGAVTWSLPLRQTAAGAVSVRWLRTTTLYERLGDYPWYASVILVIVMLLRPRTCCSRRPLAFRTERSYLNCEKM